MTDPPPGAFPDDGQGSADESQEGPSTGFWGTVRSAVRGTSADLTAVPIRKAIVLLAVPMVLEMVMESVFAVVDIFFVSQLGANAVATVGLTESMLTLVYTVAMGLSIGVTAMVARRTGEKDPAGASRATAQSILLGLFLAALLGILGVIYAERLLFVMGASPEIVDQGIGYTRIMFGGNGVILLLFLINASFRGAGDAAIAMRMLWLANGLNLVLDPCLIFGLGPFPELGVTGAAVATNTGRGTAVLVQLFTLLRLPGRVRIRREHLRIEPILMGRLVRLSASGTFQVLVGTASWIALVRIVSGFGSEALAGYTIAIRIILFALLPSWGMANAAATMVGQGLGAGKPDRSEAAVWIACKLNLYFLGLVGVLFIVFAPEIVGTFGSDPVTTAYAVDGLRIIAAGFFFYAYGMVLTQSFNGAGDTWTPTVINLFIFWLFEIPVALVLAHALEMGARGAFVAITLAFSSLAVVSAVVFKRGRWKSMSV